MKIREIREIVTIEELANKIQEEEKNLEDLKFLLATKQLENTAKIRNTKLDIARLKTTLKERQKQNKDSKSKN